MRKKRGLLLVLLLILAIGAALIGARLFSSPPPEPAEVESLLNALSGRGSYCFASQCYVTTEGEQREYFLLSGEKSGADSHFRGNILGTEIELYLVEDVLYQRNGDGKWRVNQAPDVQQALTLFAELDPASAFSHTALGELEYLGQDDSQGGKKHVLSCTPTASGWVGDYFTDIRYTLWVSCRGRELLRAELSGVLKDDPDTQLSLGLEISGLGEELVITPPDLSRGGVSPEVKSDIP